jgi:hypothetical protein
MSTDNDDFGTAVYDFLAEACLQTARPIRKFLKNTDEEMLSRLFRWTRNIKSRDRSFDAEGQAVLGELDDVADDDLERFFNLFAAASDAEILSVIRRYKQAAAVVASSADLAAEPVQLYDHAVAEPAAVPVLVGRDWANGDDETPRESALLPPPPPIDAMPAYSMRFPVRRADEPQLVRSAYSLDRSIKALRDGDVRTKEADLLSWPELNDSGEYYTSDEVVEFSLMAYHPDRRARLITMSPETAAKFGVVFGVGRPAQPWLAARLENGIIIKGILNLDTWARFAEALLKAPEAGSLPPAEPEPPRSRSRRRPDRFIRPIELIGDGWAF